MKNRRAPLLVAAACLAWLSGCATVTRGVARAPTVASMPAGATVSRGNTERCETPCTPGLEPGHSVAVQPCRTGYGPVNTPMMSHRSGAAGTAGNVLVDGLIGVGVDAASGAMRELSPNPLRVQLVAGEPGCTAPALPAVPDGGQALEDALRAQKNESRPAQPVLAR